MAQPLVTDALWAVVAPLLPPERPKPKGGRPRIPDRAALAGILFALKSGIPWEMLPQELGCGSGMTCWRRLRDWQRAGVWLAIHRALLDRLGRCYRIDWSRAALDSASVPAPAGGEHTARNPTDRGKLGTKHHLVVDRHGVPLAAVQSAANVHDSKLLEATVDAIRPIRMPYGRPRKRPGTRLRVQLHADKAYDFRCCRESLRRRGITPRIARCGIDPSERLGRFRRVAERTLSWLHRFRRLRVRASGAPTSTWPSSCWAAPSSAGAFFSEFCQAMLCS